MRRIRWVHVVVVVAIVTVIVWVARNTEWGEITLPAPLRGEAARDPLYAARRLVEGLGATAARERELGATGTDAVVVLANWGWDINAARRRAFEQWVEGGGRLVVDSTLITGSAAFASWSGIERVTLDLDEAADGDEGALYDGAFDECVELLELGYDADGGERELGHYEACAFDPASWLVTTRRLDWALAGDDGLQAARVAIGEGFVTVVNGAPFHFRELFAGDHAEVLVAAIDLRAADRVVFVSEEDYAALPELVWRHGAPVVVVGLLALALALWRGAVRFGPLVAATERARRSLGEQILGTGRFAVRVGGGAALAGAAVRALHEAAARRVAGYEALGLEQRIEVVARLSAVDAAALAGALDRKGQRTALELRGDLALLETARRQLISGSQWSKHGKRI